MVRRLENTLLGWQAALTDFLLAPRPGERPRWPAWAWIAALYLGGLAVWAVFFNFGNIPYNWEDWAEISAPRIAFIQNAVTTGQLPLHMQDASALRGVTDRYLAVPDVILSPQMLLLAFMPVTVWVLANTLLLYTLGFLGLLWFWRRYRLSPLAFALLFLLFNFNGYISAHLSVGHVNFSGYFLFPLLAAMLVALLEHPDGRLPGWRWVAGFSFLMFYLLLNGSFHQFVWWLIFLGLVGLFAWRFFGLVLKTLVFTSLLSLFRLLPPVLEMGKFDNEFLGGYPSLYDLWQFMVRLADPYASLTTRSLFTRLTWWEFDLYVGLLGALVLLGFGLFGWLKRWDHFPAFQPLLLPVVITTLLAMGRVFQYARIIPIPLLQGERVSSRIIILPFLILLLIAAINLRDGFDRLRRLHPALQWSLIGLVGLLGYDLWQHLRVWRVTAAADAFTKVAVDLAGKVVKNHPDPAYTNLLLVGGAVTLLTALFLLVMALREPKQSSRPA